MYIHRHIRSSTSLSDYKTLNSKRKESKQCRLRQKTARPHIKRSPPLRNSNRFSGSQTRLRPYRITSKQSSGAFLSTNTESYLPVITLPPGVRRSKNKWIRQGSDHRINTEVLYTQRRPVYSLSFVRDTICPGQTYISSGVTEMALWRFPDPAPAVCPFYEQTASGACFSALRAVMRAKGSERSGYPYFVLYATQNDCNSRNELVATSVYTLSKVCLFFITKQLAPQA